MFVDTVCGQVYPDPTVLSIAIHLDRNKPNGGSMLGQRRWCQCSINWALASAILVSVFRIYDEAWMAGSVFMMNGFVKLWQNYKVTLQGIQKGYQQNKACLCTQQTRSAGPMLVHCWPTVRLWANNEPKLSQRLMFAGYVRIHLKHNWTHEIQWRNGSAVQKQHWQ